MAGRMNSWRPNRGRAAGVSNQSGHALGKLVNRGQPLDGAAAGVPQACPLLRVVEQVDDGALECVGVPGRNVKARRLEWKPDLIGEGSQEALRAPTWLGAARHR